MKTEELWNCFEAAFRYIADVASEGGLTAEAVEGVTLVHGFVFSSRYDGWIVHAWIERDGVVIDNSNGNGGVAVLPLDQFYRVARVRNPVKYLGVTAFKVGAKFKTYGPWDDGLRSAAEEVTVF